MRPPSADARRGSEYSRRVPEYKPKIKRDARPRRCEEHPEGEKGEEPTRVTSESGARNPRKEEPRLVSEVSEEPEWEPSTRNVKPEAEQRTQPEGTTTDSG
jgi:hypothetical protein